MTDRISGRGCEPAETAASRQLAPRSSGSTSTSTSGRVRAAALRVDRRRTAAVTTRAAVATTTACSDSGSAASTSTVSPGRSSATRSASASRSGASTLSRLTPTRAWSAPAPVSTWPLGDRGGQRLADQRVQVGHAPRPGIGRDAPGPRSRSAAASTRSAGQLARGADDVEGGRAAGAAAAMPVSTAPGRRARRACADARTRPGRGCGSGCGRGAAERERARIADGCESGRHTQTLRTRGD